MSVNNFGKTDVRLRSQWKVAKVSNGREVTTGRVQGHTAKETVSPEVSRVFRNRIRVQLDESQIDPMQVEQLDKLLYEYRSVFAEV